MAEMKIAEKEPCKACGGMGIVQEFNNFPGRFKGDSIFRQVARYTKKCTACGGNHIWEPRPNN